MSQTEQLRCNICGTKVSSQDAMMHSSTSTHGSFKHKLEKDLEAVRKGRYVNDKSIVLQWKDSI